jgi:hypothetical protein
MDKFTPVSNSDGTVSLRTIWGKYVTAESDGTLTAESDQNRDRERFNQTVGPNGTVAFRSHHGRYMTVRNDGSLAATRENRTDTELFLAVNNGDSTVSFFTWNRKFVTVHSNSTTSSEKFRMLSCAQGVKLRCSNGSFLAAHRRDQSITADSAEDSAGCFSLTVHSDGKLSLKSYFGQYVTAQVNGTLTADGDRAEGWQQFRRVGNSDGTFCLITAHGALVDATKVNAKAGPRRTADTYDQMTAAVKHNDHKNHSHSHENDTLPAVTALPSLFCWSYTQTSGYEWDTVCQQREHRFSIFNCNDWAVFTLEPKEIGPGAQSTAIYGPPAPVGTQPGGQLILNTDLFLRAWQKIKEGGQFKKNQWTVKVDVDAVFFPDRLRDHIKWKGNPWHTKAYFKNCQQFNSMQGPLEVYSQAAMDAFFGGFDNCKWSIHGNFGEDIFMQHCMPMLGINPLIDWDLIADQYCGTLPYTCACAGPETWKAALHPCKSTDTWLNCHKISIEKQAAHKEAAS